MSQAGGAVQRTVQSRRNPACAARSLEQISLEGRGEVKDAGLLSGAPNAAADQELVTAAAGDRRQPTTPSIPLCVAAPFEAPPAAAAGSAHQDVPLLRRCPFHLRLCRLAASSFVSRLSEITARL